MEKFEDVLNDPEKMGQIFELAKGFGISPEESETPSPETDTAGIAGILQMLQQSKTPDGKQDALIHALMPYLHPARQKRLQRAIRIARISQLAGYALKNYSDQL